MKAIDDFEQLSTLSYGLTQQLLFRYSKEEVKHVTPPTPDRRKLSFSMGDREIESVELSCEWISLQEYTSRTGRSMTDISGEASQGLLGPVQKHPKTGEDIVI
jgi:hypothetical protein